MNPSIRDIKRPIPKHVITKFSKLYTAPLNNYTGNLKKEHVNYLGINSQSTT